MIYLNNGREKLFFVFVAINKRFLARHISEAEDECGAAHGSAFLLQCTGNRSRKTPLRGLPPCSGEGGTRSVTDEGAFLQIKIDDLFE